MWQETDWETALALVAERLGRVVKQHGGAQIGALAAPTSTLEEFHLLARIARGLGSANLDHRLRRTDFRDEANDPLYPALGCSIAELEQVASALVVGSNLRKEVPLLAHRLRKAALRGAKISFVNPQRYEYLFPVANYLASNGLDMFESSGRDRRGCKRSAAARARRSRLRRSSQARSRPMRIARSRSSSATVRAA